MDHEQPPPRASAPEDTLAKEVEARMQAPVDYDAWKPMAGGATYLAPKGRFVADDGGVDVVVHFNAAQMAEKEWRKSGVNAVIVSAAYGEFGTTAYHDAFVDPKRFGAMLDDLMRRLAKASPAADRKLHVRRLALVSWSAGFAATEMILRQPRYYAMVDAVVLLDSLHAGYTEGRRVDAKMLRTFARFAVDAAKGTKAMVVSHSAIVPPDYASTTETAAVLCDEAAAARIEEHRQNDRGMTEAYHADRGDLHVRGFRGQAAHDHIDQLFLVGEVMRAYVLPRWTALAVTEERVIGLR